MSSATQIVINSHVMGKMYLENLKQFRGHSSLYGETGLQALYLSNLNTPLEHQDQFFKLGINKA